MVVAIQCRFSTNASDSASLILFIVIGMGGRKELYPFYLRNVLLCVLLPYVLFSITNDFIQIIQGWWSSVPMTCPGNQTTKLLIWTRPNQTHKHSWRTHTFACPLIHFHPRTHTFSHTHSDLWECHQWEMMIESNHEQQTLTEAPSQSLSPPISTSLTHYLHLPHSLSPSPSLTISLPLSLFHSLSQELSLSSSLSTSLSHFPTHFLPLFLWVKEMKHEPIDGWMDGWLDRWVEA